MNTNHTNLTPEVAMGLTLTGRYVDEQVDKGRALDDVLNEDGQGATIWRPRGFMRAWTRARTHA